MKKKSKAEVSTFGLLQLNLAARAVVIPTETEEQKLLVKILDYNNIKFFHPANEGKKSKSTAGLHKAMGLKAGVADVVMVDRTPNTIHIPNIWVEMKRKGQKQSAEQLEWEAIISRGGGIYKVCYSAMEAVIFLQSLGFKICIIGGMK